MTLFTLQFRMQQDWLKKFNSCKAAGGGIPPVPQHPRNLPPHQIQIMYNKLMEHVIFRFIIRSFKGLDVLNLTNTIYRAVASIFVRGCTRPSGANPAHIWVTGAACNEPFNTKIY